MNAGENNPETHIPADWFAPQEITDIELRKHLTAKGLDPHTAPAYCVEEIARTWDLPITQAQELVWHLQK